MSGIAMGLLHAGQTTSYVLVLLSIHSLSSLTNQKNWMIFNYLKSLCPNMQCTMEIESDDHLPFLYISEYGWPRSWPTLTLLYWNVKLHHHMVNNHSVLSTLAHRVTAICTQENWISIVCSNRMATMIDWSFVLSIHLTGRIRLDRI